MNFSFQGIAVFFGFLLLNVSSFAQTANYISLKQRSEILENKKKIANDVDLYFDNNKKTITKYYHSSPEFIMLINSLGEIKTYYPASNEVAYKQIAELSSKRNLIYYFANNLTDDLGLVDEGFSLILNTYENQFYVTTWKAPSILKGIESVKMVFENGLPVYSEYQSLKKKIIKKIYYTSYKDFTQFRLPQKIIEISYLPSGDSLINRTLFSNVKVSNTADDKYFNFKIPDNAKPLDTAKNK
jgi:hypothetical protein